MKVVALLSGGLDSATALAIALDMGHEVFPLSFHYAQRHVVEVDSAISVVAHYRYKSDRGAGDLHLHPIQIVKIHDLAFRSALTDTHVDVPTSTDANSVGDIPVTYVPARNSMFLAVATGYAESIGADAVWCGFNAVDYSGYPDCRPEFVEAMEKALALGTKRGVEGSPIMIVAPLIRWTKKMIVEAAVAYRVPIHLTWSCYIGGKRPCGECDSCVIRARGFAEAMERDTALEVM
jgi:7-cyano-7-deazaguanine synthase